MDVLVVFAVGTAAWLLFRFWFENVQVELPAQAWVTLIVGTAAATGVIVTWRQKNRLDDRSEWWRRASWALEQTFSSDARKAALGWSLIQALIASPFANKYDLLIVQVVAEHAALDGEDQLWEYSRGGEEDPADLS